VTELRHLGIEVDESIYEVVIFFKKRVKLSIMVGDPPVISKNQKKVLEFCFDSKLNWDTHNRNVFQRIGIRFREDQLPEIIIAQHFSHLYYWLRCLAW